MACSFIRLYSLSDVGDQLKTEALMMAQVARNKA